MEKWKKGTKILRVRHDRFLRISSLKLSISRLPRLEGCRHSSHNIPCVLIPRHKRCSALRDVRAMILPQDNVIFRGWAESNYYNGHTTISSSITRKGEGSDANLPIKRSIANSLSLWVRRDGLALLDRFQGIPLMGRLWSLCVVTSPLRHPLLYTPARTEVRTHTPPAHASKSLLTCFLVE